jgi:hypothetical protein
LIVVRFHLRFASPGFFLNDPRLVVTLDQRTLYDGSFKSGFEVSLDVVPGTHVLETAIHLGGVARKQQIPLALDGTKGYRDVPAVHGTLEYSRLTGNFKKRVSLSARH